MTDKESTISTLAVTIGSTAAIAFFTGLIGYMFQYMASKREQERNNRDLENERERNKRDVENERQRNNRELERKRAEDIYKNFSALMEKLYYQMKSKMLKPVSQNSIKVYVKNDGVGDADVEVYEKAKADWWEHQIYNHTIVVAVFGSAIGTVFLAVHKKFKVFTQELERCPADRDFKKDSLSIRLEITKFNLLMMDAIQREKVGQAIENNESVEIKIVKMQEQFEASLMPKFREEPFSMVDVQV